MNPFLVYFTKGLSITRPIWTPIYWDAFGFGYLVTVTMPSYNNDTGDLLGVIGLDVPV